MASLILLPLVFALQGRVVAFKGTVRDDDSGHPLANACVEVRPGPHTECTDSSGAYLVFVGAGQYTVRVFRVGFTTQQVDIDVGLDPELRLDFALTPLVQALKSVRVVGRGRTVDEGDALPSRSDDEIGAWSASRHQLQSRSALVGSDVLQATALAGGLASNPEAPTSLHVRGGASDQNAVLLDGIPLYNATHFGGVLSAVNPDIVSGSTLHAGAPSARFGDALSSVIELETADNARGRLLFRGALDPISARQAVLGQLPGGRGSFALAGRVVSRELLGSFEHRTSSTTSFGDLFGRISFPVRGGILEAFALGSRDRLGFNALASSDNPKVAVAVPSEPVGLRNRFDWSSETVALVWKGDLRPATELRLRMWRTAFDSRADWAAPTSPLALTSALHEFGLGADLERRAGLGLFAAGMRVLDRGTRYQVTSDGQSKGDSLPVSYGVNERSPLLALYAEHRARAGSQWTLLTGLRTEFGVGRVPAIDPRVSLRYAASKRVSLLAGYARMHQYTQSLRNDESLVDALVGVGLPASANGSDIPVARSDQLSIGARIAFNADTHLSVESYVRRLDRLLLVAPTSADPFARTDVQSGSGRAIGASAWFEHADAHISLLAGYAFGVTDRRADGVRYQPTFSVAHSVATSLVVRPRTNTAFHLAIRAQSGRRARTHSSVVEWPIGTILTEFADLSGSPVISTDAPGVSALAAYARVDVGVQHEWRVVAPGVNGHITGSLRLENLFARTNVLGVYVPSGGGPRQALPMAPRAVRIGLAWEF